MQPTILSRDQPAAMRGTALPGGSPNEPTLQFITFTIDAAEYGIDIMVIREIKGWIATTTIPNAPSYVRGVINLRGIIIPIFDLRDRFGMGLTAPTEMHVVIIVDIGTRTVGLLVDTVSDIIAIAPTDIRPIPEMGMAAEAHFLEGLAALGDRMVTLVSLDGLFSESTEEATPLDPNSAPLSSVRTTVLAN